MKLYEVHEVDRIYEYTYIPRVLDFFFFPLAPKISLPLTCLPRNTRLLFPAFIAFVCGSPMLVTACIFQLVAIYIRNSLQLVGRLILVGNKLKRKCKCDEEDMSFSFL